MVGRLSVESADSPYQTCLIFDHRLSRPTGIGRLESADSRPPILRGPSGYGHLHSEATGIGILKSANIAIGRRQNGAVATGLKCVEGGSKIQMFGALDGGPQCRLSIPRNGNVPCRYFINFPVYFLNSLMSPVDFKKWQCPLSLFLKVSLSILREFNVTCRFQEMAVSPCRI